MKSAVWGNALGEVVWNSCMGVSVMTGRFWSNAGHIWYFSPPFFVASCLNMHINRGIFICIKLRAVHYANLTSGCEGEKECQWGAWTGRHSTVRTIVMYATRVKCCCTCLYVNNVHMFNHVISKHQGRLADMSESSAGQNSKRRRVVRQCYSQQCKLVVNSALAEEALWCVLGFPR